MSRITPILSLLACVFTAPAYAEEGRSRLDVERTIRDAAPAITACGAGFAEQTVQARFTIDTDGRVRQVQLKGRDDDDDVSECMKRRIAAMRFESAEEPSSVTYPFKIGQGNWRTAREAWAGANWKGSGQLTKKTLDGLLVTLASDVRKCGEGTARTRFTIRPDGKVRDVRVAKVDEKTEECVVRRVGRVRFPNPSKPTHVDHSFELGVSPVPSNG